MCLTVKKFSKKQTAKKDITVYKRVYDSNLFDNHKVNDGDEFTGVIMAVNCSGRIHKNGGVWFCTNNPMLDGNKSPVKFGFKYSWLLDDNVKSIIVNGEEINNKCYLTPYRNFPIEIGETYTSDLIKNEDNDVNYGLHSFEKIEDVKMDGYGTYVKCIIPKGSKYYKGIFKRCNSYASDTLKYTEIVE